MSTKNQNDTVMKMITAAGLSARALETTLRNHLWRGKRIERACDKVITDTFNMAPGSDATTTSTKKMMSPSEPLWKAVNKAHRDLSIAWKHDTVVWRDGGTRLLSSSIVPDFYPRMDSMMRAYDEAVEACADEWDKMVARQAPRLGDLFHVDQYPTAEELPELCHATIEYQPIQTAGDFRVEVPEEWMDDLRKSSERTTQKAIDAAMKDPWTRLHGAVTDMAKALTIPDKIFRDSLIDNVREVCDLLPALNVTGNKTLNAMGQKVRQALTEGFTAKDLRDPPHLAKQDTHNQRDRSSDAQTARAAKASQARDILKEINSIM